MTHGASAGAHLLGKRYLPWLILFLSHWPFLTHFCWSCESSFFFFFCGFRDRIGCIAKRLICWSQIDAIPKCLFWMMGFAEIMHYFVDLPVILNWTLQLYFGIILCCLCCLSSRLIFSHGSVIIYFFGLCVLWYYQSLWTCRTNPYLLLRHWGHWFYSWYTPVCLHCPLTLRYFLSVLNYCPQKAMAKN